MKCDELKVHKAYNRWIDEEMPTPNDDLICNEVYLKSEVDTAIAELNAKLEDAKATAYAESVDVGMENRKLKRSLWLARAERASEKVDLFFYARASTELLNINGRPDRIPEPKGWWRQLKATEWMRIWQEVERKCRAKAEEYK